MILKYLSAMWMAIAPALGNHLWQSTLFAITAGILTLPIRIPSSSTYTLRESKCQQWKLVSRSSASSTGRVRRGVGRSTGKCPKRTRPPAQRAVSYRE